MPELKERFNSLLQGFDAHEPELAKVGPAALHDARKKAAERFAEAGIPTTKHEEWKYTSLRPLAEGTFGPAGIPVLTEDELKAARFGNFDGIRLQFVNGRYYPELSRTDGAPKRLVVRSLAQELAGDYPSLLTHLGQVATLANKLGSFNDERFVWLNTAHLADGAYVFVPRGLEVEPLIHLAFFASGDEPYAQHPRVLVVLEEGAQARIVESYNGIRGNRFTNTVTEVELALDSKLEHTRIQNEDEGAIHLGTLAVRQKANSTYVSNVATFGGKISRLDLWSFVGGEHAETSLNGVYVGRGSQVLDHHTRIDHAMPNCHSFEVYKGILADRAEGVFNGKIFVYLDAQKTDAKQTNQALLLSRTASINTKPQLEIFADDVKCTHGATVGQLRQDAMFYLRSRGIPEAEARDILIHAFAAEVLEQISDKQVRKETERLLNEKLRSVEIG